MNCLSPQQKQNSSAMLDDNDKKLQKEESYLQENFWQEDKSPLVIYIFKETK